MAGGAGAVGAGAYEATQGQDTGPASKTIGPHDSNVANILDPSVKPDPAKMRGNQEPQQQQTSRHVGTDGPIGDDHAVSGAAAEPSDNRVSTDSQGHHHLHKKHAEQQGEKKPSLIKRVRTSWHCTSASGSRSHSVLPVAVRSYELGFGLHDC